MNYLLKLAAIVGPTAVGKTSIAIQVARYLNAEILSCDSMQVYKGMDIGTAKASPQEQSAVPHHLIDIVEVDYDFTVADYQARARKLIEEINRDSKIPILVGGTGLYYQAVVDNYSFNPMENCPDIRLSLEKQAISQGLEILYLRLYEVDPEYAALIKPQDKKRIIRALEVYELTGQPFSRQQTRQRNTYNLAAVGLYLERENLYKRINDRVDQMLANGLIEEFKRLRELGYGLHNNAMQALGYKQILFYLDGLLTYQEMVNEIKQETRRYAKRQYTWFKRDQRIAWFDVGETPENELVEKICGYMEGQLLRA